MLNVFFLVWLRTGSNPADINRFQSHSGNTFLCKTILMYFFVILELNNKKMTDNLISTTEIFTLDDIKRYNYIIS